MAIRFIRATILSVFLICAASFAAYTKGDLVLDLSLDSANQIGTGTPLPLGKNHSKVGHKIDFPLPSNPCNGTEDEDTSCGTIEYLGCTGSKKFYHESAIKMSWFEAWEYCRTLGLHLASIDSRYEQTFIELFLPKLEVTTIEEYWTSGTDLGKEGTFSWMATGKLLTYSNFRPGEPNNRFGTEDCIELVIVPGLSGYGWNDRTCLTKGYVLCQQDLRYPEKFITIPNNVEHDDDDETESKS